MTNDQKEEARKIVDEIMASGCPHACHPATGCRWYSELRRKLIQLDALLRA